MEQQVEVEIHAPATRVWDVLADVERWPEWAETVTSATRLDPGPLAIHARVRLEQVKLPPPSIE